MINGSITLIADDSQKMGLVNLEDEMEEFERKSESWYGSVTLRTPYFSLRPPPDCMIRFVGGNNSV